MDGSNFYKNQYIAFIANRIDVKVHRHSTLQIVLSLDNEFSSYVNQTQIDNIQIILFNKFISHSCFTNKSKVLVFLIETESYLGSIFRFTMQNQDYITLERNSKILSLVNIGMESNFSKPELYDKFLDYLFIKRHINSDPIDARILSAMDFIKRNIQIDIDLAKTANYIHLSESRFRHLFNEQIGMPFSKYLMWTRLKMVFKNSAKHKMNFTEAALSAGFSDQAHFNKVFSQTFGISPNGLKKNSRFIQVYL